MVSIYEGDNYVIATDEPEVAPTRRNRRWVRAKHLPRHNCSCRDLSWGQNRVVNSTCLLVSISCDFPEINQYDEWAIDKNCNDYYDAIYGKRDWKIWKIKTCHKFQRLPLRTDTTTSKTWIYHRARCSNTLSPYRDPNPSVQDFWHSWTWSDRTLWIFGYPWVLLPNNLVSPWVCLYCRRCEFHRTNNRTFG